MLRPEWRLSGPSRFARAIAADLEYGRSVSVLLPAIGFPDGLRGAVREALPDVEVNRFRLGDLAGRRRRVVDVLYERLGLERSGYEERVDAASLARHPQLERRLIWVDGRGASAEQSEAWTAFLRRYAAAATEVPIVQRTVFATLCAGIGAPPAPERDPLLVTHWWWGVVRPIDTEVFVVEAVGERERPPAFAETVAQIAAFDLDLAATLVEGWDGGLGQLGRLLRDHPTSDGGGHRWSARPSPHPQPPPDSLRAWSAGVVNAWGQHDPHPHPCHASASDPGVLARLIWRGQVRGLMPLIEVQRQALAEWVHERRDRLSPHWREQDIRSLEVGALAKIFEMPPFRNDQGRASTVRWLHRARNKIAHLEILDPSELEKARSLSSR